MESPKGEKTIAKLSSSWLVQSSLAELRFALYLIITTTTHHPPSPAVNLKDDTGPVGEYLGECVYDNGVCRTHGEAEKLWRPSKVWAKKKNGVFGWKYSKETYFSCRKFTRKPVETDRPTFVSMGGSTALHSTTNFTVLCNGGIRGRRGFESKKSTDRK